MRTPRLNRLLVLLGLTTFAWVQAVGTPAGTVISNQANADYTLDDGSTQTQPSNTISTTVSAVCAVSVTPDGTPAVPGQSVSLLPGEPGVLAYAVRNVGNQANSFDLSSVTDASSTFTPQNVRIYRDTNGNGALDAGEDTTSITNITLGATPDTDSARLLLVAPTGTNDRGSAYLSLNASCGAAAGGASDTNNYGAVSAGQPPALSLQKTFSPSLVKPGDTSTVTLSAANGGKGPSREVVVTDALNTPELSGSSFVPGSARASAGTVEYSADGLNFGATETNPVAVIRLRLPGLAPGQSASLSFGLKTSAAAENKSLLNRASLTSRGTPGAGADASLSVQYTPGVALGPVGNPQAAEGSPADSQSRDFAVVGQTMCFTQTLQNTGNVADDFTLTPTLASGEASLVLKDAGGQPLSQPLHLEPGQSVNVQVCATLSGTDALKLTLNAVGTRGEQNATTDLIAHIETGLPELQKTVDPSGQVTAGQTLTYTLSAHNPYSVALTGVVITDPLDAGLSFVSASDGGVLQSGAVVWNVGSLAPGETRRLTLVARVLDGEPDGATIANTFTLSGDQFDAPLPSPTVKSPVWSADLAVGKTVDPTDGAAVGDRLTYTVHIRNLSKSGTLASLTVTDTMPVGVVYIPGTAQLNGQPLADPQVAGRVLTWTLSGLAAQSEAVLTYAARVTPQAGGDIVNSVVVSGRGANTATANSNVASAHTKLRGGIFAPLSEIVGTVFVDRNRDGVYEANLDTPLERARVVLADGRISLTDAQGRYHFANVPSGFTALRLDPASVPYPALSLPQDGGRPGSRGLNLAGGVTSADFPLEALAGEVSALRDTTLHQGPLTVHKTLAQNEDGSYTASLTLSSVSPLADLQLQDPLPPGARLLNGQNSLNLARLDAAGATLGYRFAYDGPAEGAVTDPTVTWRNP